MYKILIADDHELIRDGLDQRIRRGLAEVIVHQTNSFEGLLTKLNDQNYDVVITDLSMENKNPLAGVRKLFDQFPEQQVIVLSMYPSQVFAVRLLKMGAKAYLNKATSSDEIVQAVKEVLSGKRYAEREILDQLIDEVAETQRNKLDALTDREMEVMLLLVAGYTPKQIADEIHIHTSTIGTYRQRIYEKLGLENMVDLTLFAVKNDLVQ